MEAITRATDGELTGVIASAAAGDDVAFGRIVGAHHDDMRRVCVFITRQDALADDAMQAAWTMVWRKLGSLTTSSIDADSNTLDVAVEPHSVLLLTLRGT